MFRPFFSMNILPSCRPGSVSKTTSPVELSRSCEPVAVSCPTLHCPVLLPAPLPQPPPPPAGRSLHQPAETVDLEILGHILRDRMSVVVSDLRRKAISQLGSALPNPTAGLNARCGLPRGFRSVSEGRKARILQPPPLKPRPRYVFRFS